MKILGIDPGLHGAWALISDGDLFVVNDLPIIGAGKQKRLNSGALSDLWRKLDISLVVLEEVHSMPREGVASAFKFGYTCGQLLGVVEGLNIPVVFVTPQVWKKHFRITSDKEDSRKKAIELFPSNREHFQLKKDHGKAEASLIALWGKVAAPSQRTEEAQPAQRKRLGDA